MRLSLICLLVLTSSVFAQRNATIPDPDPEVERRAFQVADGFEVNLFAADPLLAKPIHMNFDAAGRLWIASSETYPQIKPGQKANDKIVILEDTKGVGRADKTTIFADGLLIPTGIEPGDGGVYVANSTELLHITERNGKGDKTRVVLSGFGTEDTHHILHTLRWGPDGLLYMNQSIYIHSHIETPWGPRHLNAGGIWAFRPETMQLDVFARGWVNSWGHTFDKYGQSFVTDGAGGEGINYCVPGAYYYTAAGAVRTLQGLNPGHPKYCGAEIVSGRHLPDDWQGNIITNDFRGNRVCRFALREDGSGFAAIQLPDVIRSTHPAFRPIDVKMGPDGAIYIADWYNPIIQHGEVDFRDPRRDVTHGRIWRITAKGRKLVERPKLVGATTEELLNHLKDPEQWTRHFAKRVLKERGAKEVLPKLHDWIFEQKDVTSPDFQQRLLETAWVYESLNEFAKLPPNANTNDHPAFDLLVGLQLFLHRPEVVAYATRLLGKSGVSNEMKIKLLAERCGEPHPRVRLEAVRALGQIPTPEAAATAMLALDHPMDKFLEYSLWLTMRELEPVWSAELRAGRIPFQKVQHLIFALKAADARGTVPTLVGLIKSDNVPKAQQVELLALLADVGGPAELAVVFERAAASEDSLVLLTALEQAVRQRNVKPSGDLGRIASFLNAGNEPVRVMATRLAGLWKVQSLGPQLFQMAGKSSGELRRAAVDSLAALGGPKNEALLEYLTDPKIPADLRTLAVVALTNFNLTNVANKAAIVLSADLKSDDVSALVGAFVGRKNGPEALAKAIETANVRLTPDVAKVALRTMRSTGRETPALVAALTKAGGLTEPRRVLSPDEMKKMVDDVRTLGDAARGEAIYRRKEMACQKCHSIGGAGGLVAPDLISIGASAQIDYIIDSLLLPNKQVKENYNSIRVDLKDGKQVTGVKVRENAKELVLRDGEDREIVIPQAKIEEKTIGGSIMPEGLVDPLTRGELLDLTRFLSELGKVGGQFTISPARIVRRWQVLETSPEAYTALYRVGTHAPAVDSSLAWAPGYSTVAGILPRETLPQFEIKRGLEKGVLVTGYARCQVEVTTPGKVRLKVNGNEGLSLWLDGSAVDLKNETNLELPTGIRTLTFGVDWAKRKNALKVELDDFPNSPARVRVIGGK